jgi:NADH dehydrogenase
MQALKTDILILGAGIGGYEAFRALAKKIAKNGLNKKITIVDQNNYFTFTPLLHEVASGSIEPRQAAIPLRELIQNTPHDFFKGQSFKNSTGTKKGSDR